MLAVINSSATTASAAQRSANENKTKTNKKLWILTKQVNPLIIIVTITSLHYKDRDK